MLPEIFGLEYSVLQSLFADVFENDKTITLQTLNFKSWKNNFWSKLINLKCMRFILVEITQSLLKSVNFKFNV